MLRRGIHLRCFVSCVTLARGLRHGSAGYPSSKLTLVMTVVKGQSHDDALPAGSSD